MPKALVPGGLARDPLYFYHLSSRLGLVLLSIPKNACTVQKAWLLRAEGIQARDVHTAAFTHLALLNKLTLSRAALAASPLLAFLRDPLERLVSGFCDKLIAPRLNLSAISAIEGAAERRGVRIVRNLEIPLDPAAPDQTLAACAAVDYRRGLTFREFIEYLAATPDLALDPHWRPQTWFLSPILGPDAHAAPPETILFPMSRITQVLSALGEPLGLTAPPPAPSPPTPPVHRPTPETAPGALADTPSAVLLARNLKPRAHDLFTPELIDTVRQRFAPAVRLWRRVKDAAEAQALAG